LAILIRFQSIFKADDFLFFFASRLLETQFLPQNRHKTSKSVKNGQKFFEIAKKWPRKRQNNQKSAQNPHKT